MVLGTFNIILVISYFLIVLYIGFKARKKEDDEGFLLGNRNIGMFVLTATLVASLFGGNTIVTLMSFLYEYGISVIWAQVGLALGCLLLAVFAPKIKRLGDKHKFYTFSDFFDNKYGKNISLLVASIMFLVYGGFLLMQFIAGGVILSSITGWSYLFSVLLMGIVIMIYITAAGFRAVVRTDVFQYFVMFLLILLSYNIFSQAKTIDPSDLQLFAAGPINIIGFFIYGILVIILAADLWQRIYAAKSIKIARRSLIYTSFIFLFLSILVLIMGLSVKSNFPDISPETALVASFTQILPNWLLGIGLIILFSAIMSTADTFIFFMSSSLSKDFFSKFEKFQKSRFVNQTKIFTVLIGIITMTLALIFTDIVDVLTAVAGSFFVLFPATLLSFWFKLKRISITLSILIGLLATINAFIFMGISIESSLVGLPVSFIVLGLGQLIFKR